MKYLQEKVKTKKKGGGWKKQDVGVWEVKMKLRFIII